MAATIAALQQAPLRSYYAQLPPLAMGSEMRDCAHWDVPTESPGANEPVVSDIPTLVLSGAYDPVTPSAWGDLVASHLSHSYVAVIPGQAHVVLASTCARTIQRAFLQNPFTEPDTRCAEVTLDLRFR
jgi:pimeloyl-ACP methyl ester carboxylesterase